MPFVYCETPGCDARAPIGKAMGLGWFLDAVNGTGLCPECAQRKLADGHVNCRCSYQSFPGFVLPSEESGQNVSRMRDAVNAAMAAVGDHE